MSPEEDSEIIHGARGWSLANDLVRLHVTAEGGMMAPVVFTLGTREISPYSLSPWTPDEADPDLPPLLRVLRGDFWCLPFGAQQDGPYHGTPAHDPWDLVKRENGELRLRLDASDTGAHIEKSITLRDGHSAVYCEHLISGLAGEWCYGNHPILDLSHLPEGAARVSVSPFRYASVYPDIFSDPANGEHQALAPGAEFTDLAAVPMAAGGSADLTRWPARPGNDDLVLIAAQSATPAQPFAWSALAADGWIWFSLKNPSDFPATLFWMSNGGRSAAPWNNRHLGRIGIEEVCSYYGDGPESSRSDPLRAQGIPTVRNFDPNQTTSLRVVQAVASAPEGFGRVTSITPHGENQIIIRDESGQETTCPIAWSFVVG